MLNMTKTLFAGAIALGATACAVSADSGPRYVEKRIPQGPRPDQYVLVRAERAEAAERPYALTGQTEKTRAQRSAAHQSHPKGTHEAY